MCPVGVYSRLGSQHGFSRWVDYKTTGSSDNWVEFQADSNYDGLLSTRRFEINNHLFIITSTIKNVTSSIIKTSLGEHLYFNLDGLDTTDLRFNGQFLDEMFGKDSAASVDSGSSIHWRDFNGVIGIDFAKQKQLHLSADTDEPSLLGLSFWRRPGTDSICVEPTVGYVDSENKFASNLIDLVHQKAFKLITKITLLS
jgi:galactose mutarotase-like enzyme